MKTLLMRGVAVVVASGVLRLSARGADLAPANPYRGMEQREEIFEFARKPEVQRVGGTWIVTFTAKAACDATVAITDRDGRIIRHLASGVLGKNAPWPFQQDTLAQRIEWDGTDTSGNAVPATAMRDKRYAVRVSLGLGAQFERDIAWAPLKEQYIEKDGKYFRTAWPPPADLPEGKWAELGVPLATTTWGDKVPCGGWFSVFAQAPKGAVENARTIVEECFGDQEPPRKADFENRPGMAWYSKNPRLAVDPVRDELYVIGPGGTPGGNLVRLDGKTGRDARLWNVSEVAVGPDGLVYAGGGPFGYLRFIFRLDRTGRPVPFPDTSEQVATEPMRATWWDKAPSLINRPSDDPFVLTHMIATGVNRHSNVHDKGFDVSRAGHIVTIVEELSPEWRAARGVTGDGYRFVQVWSPEGRLLSSEAVPSVGNLGHGVRMDRDGNLYVVYSAMLPEDRTMLDGITDVAPGYRVFGGHGSLVKYRGRGGDYPLSEGPGVRVRVGRQTSELSGALWAYGGVTDAMVPDCSCHHSRFDLDGWARAWIPARQLKSVVVLDSNGNRVARIGRYGNTDDEGIRFAWVRAVAVSDTALYALDYGNRRILKAALSYACEETVPLP